MTINANLLSICTSRKWQRHDILSPNIKYSVLVENKSTKKWIWMSGTATGHSQFWNQTKRVVYVKHLIATIYYFAVNSSCFTAISKFFTVIDRLILKIDKTIQITKYLTDGTDPFSNWSKHFVGNVFKKTGTIMCVTLTIL